jgi:hypothetical protein
MYQFDDFRTEVYGGYGHDFWFISCMRFYDYNPQLTSEELKLLVRSEHIFIFPLRNSLDVFRSNHLTPKQYSQKIAIYLSKLRNIN